MERLRREMNRLFTEASGTSRTAAPGFPAMNVWTGEEGALVTVELPGVNPEDLDVSVVRNVLTLSGNREVVKVPEGARFHRHERRHGQFSRTFQLPFTVASDRVEATFKNGVLEIRLPRTEQEKPKKISVSAS
jgi:HSP20 family protein